jgi:hypothetical protein
MLMAVAATAKEEQLFEGSICDRCDCKAALIDPALFAYVFTQSTYSV